MESFLGYEIFHMWKAMEMAWKPLQKWASEAIIKTKKAEAPGRKEVKTQVNLHNVVIITFHNNTGQP